MTCATCRPCHPPNCAPLDARDGADPSKRHERVDPCHPCRRAHLRAILARCPVTRDKAGSHGVEVLSTISIPSARMTAYPRLPSGCLRQRVAVIVICLARGARLIIMDEPTTALTYRRTGHLGRTGQTEPSIRQCGAVHREWSGSDVRDLRSHRYHLCERPVRDGHRRRRAGTACHFCTWGPVGSFPLVDGPKQRLHGSSA